ncbi:hypothetical protein [Bradyrhizobium valentinum]|uniref:Uncharacterized protein n=1 Tax=Bradyrhizobium valentinum TaxID=1518501 RepID=A0A0R3M4W8_9BRAD|nr:hypothetical protein [Bradyrhizobium valentinum]KRR14971.1 hypothetical protein CP49_23420 [Bradyrhizobium valentinum]
MLFRQALLHKLAFKLCQAGLQQVAIVLNIIAMRTQASQLLINHFSPSFDELGYFHYFDATLARVEYIRKVRWYFPGRVFKSRLVKPAADL